MRTDLLGNIIPDGSPKTDAERKREQRRLRERPKGYASPPGTGPEGETCASCVNCVVSEHSNRRYYKCKLVRPTRGYGTDIRKRSPACRKWTPK